jgi:hypothetical protein
MPDKSVWIRRRKERLAESWGNWRYQIDVSSPKYVASPIEYGRTDTHEVRINFLDPAFATVSATNGDDHRLRKQLTWSIVAPGQAGAIERFRREREGEEENKQLGATRLGPFQPGAYELVLMLAESSFDNRELLRMPVTLAAGENALTATVPELYSLVIVPAPGANMRNVNVAPKAGKTATFAYRTEVKNNRIALDNVPAGEYLLSDSEGRMTVRVPTAGEVVYNPPSYDCTVVSDLRPGGKIEALGFRNGDKVIRVDGSEITSRDVGKALFRLSITKESTTWTLLRNGREVELTFSGVELANITGKGAQDRESFNLQSGYRNE